MKKILITLLLAAVSSFALMASAPLARAQDQGVASMLRSGPNLPTGAKQWAYFTLTTGEVGLYQCQQAPYCTAAGQWALVGPGGGGGGGSMTWPANAGVPACTGTPCTAWSGSSFQVGAGANDLVQLNSSGALPAVSGANLTGLSGTVPEAAGPGNPFVQTTPTTSGAYLGGVTYVTPAMNWSETIAEGTQTLTAGVAGSINLPAGIIGVDVSSNMGYQVLLCGSFYTTGVNIGQCSDATGEAVLVTGGSYSVATGGTILFTPFYSHGQSAAYQVVSASTGIQETYNAACGMNPTYYDNVQCHVIIPANGFSTTAEAGWTFSNANYFVYGSIFVHGGQSTIDGSGVVLACRGRAACVQVGVIGVSSTHFGGNKIADLNFRAAIPYSGEDVAYQGSLITNTAANGTYKTITTAAAHHFRAGDLVTIQFTDNSGFWGDALVADCGNGSSAGACTTSSTTFRILSGGSASSIASPGVVALAYSAILDNGTSTQLPNIGFDVNGGVGQFNLGFDVWDDENLTIDHFNNQGVGVNSSATFAGTFLWSGGAQNGTGYQLAPVITIANSTLTADFANAITVYNSNGLYIDNTVIQSTGLWEIYGSNLTGNYQGTHIRNLYNNGPCSGLNPASPARTPFPGLGNAGVIFGPGTSAALNTIKGGGGVTGCFATNGSAPISAISETGTGPYTVTVTSTLNPGVGTSNVTIVGVSPTGYNGTQSVTSSNSASFQFSIATSLGAGTSFGTAQGATQFSYYIVAHDATAGTVTSPMQILNSDYSSGTTVVSWPRIANGADAISYDVIRSMQAAGAVGTVYPSLGNCGGGAGTTCGYVAQGISQLTACAGTLVCSYTDTPSNPTVGYATNPTYYPQVGNYSGPLNFWPAAIVVESYNTHPAVIEDFEQYPIVGIGLAGNPLQEALECNDFQVTSPGGYSECPFSNTTANNAVRNQAVMLLSDGGFNNPAGSDFMPKGRLNFTNIAGLPIDAHHVITVADSQTALTQATEGGRPPASANDVFIGLDNPANSAATAGQLSFGSPISITNYIAQIGDGINANWLERLSATVKEFNVPVKFDHNVTLANGLANGCLNITTGLVGSQACGGAGSAPYVGGGGTAQAQTATYSPAITALTAGLEVAWLPAAANTAAGPTFSPNGLTPKPITKLGTAAVVANDLTTLAIAYAVYDGAEWQLQNPQSNTAVALATTPTQCGTGYAPAGIAANGNVQNCFAAAIAYPFTAPVGTATAPTYTFVVDTTTGIYNVPEGDQQAVTAVSIASGTGTATILSPVNKISWSAGETFTFTGMPSTPTNLTSLNGVQYVISSVTLGNPTSTVTFAQSSGIATGTYPSSGTFSGVYGQVYGGGLAGHQWVFNRLQSSTGNPAQTGNLQMARRDAYKNRSGPVDMTGADISAVRGGTQVSPAHTPGGLLEVASSATAGATSISVSFSGNTTSWSAVAGDPLLIGLLSADKPAGIAGDADLQLYYVAGNVTVAANGTTSVSITPALLTNLTGGEVISPYSIMTQVGDAPGAEFMGPVYLANVANGCLNISSSIVGSQACGAGASIPYVAGAGTAQAQTATFSPAITTLAAGLQVSWLPAAANTAAGPTFSPNGLTPKPITKNGATALVASDLTTSAIAVANYDGAEWQLQNPQTTSGGGGATWNTIGSSTNNAVIPQGAYGTIFSYTAQSDFLWENNAAATSSLSQPCPGLELQADYWNGTSSAPYGWALLCTAANGTNGPSTFIINPIGMDPGAKTVQVPNLQDLGLISAPALGTDASGNLIAKPAPLPAGGGTMGGELITAASASGGAGFNLPPGSPPTTPNNGDCWTTILGFYCQIAGVTVGPMGSGGGGSMTWPSNAGIQSWSSGTAWGTAYGTSGTGSTLALTASPTFTGTAVFTNIQFSGTLVSTGTGPNALQYTLNTSSCPTFTTSLSGYCFDTTANGGIFHYYEAGVGYIPAALSKANTFTTNQTINGNLTVNGVFTQTCLTCANEQISTVNAVAWTAPSGTQSASGFDTNGEWYFAENGGSKTYLDDLWGNPSTDGYVLSSTHLGVRSWVANGSGGSMTWPATPGIPVCTGTPCAAWGTTLTAPAGAIVGTNDTQSLTNKTVDGVSPATMGYVDPTSSIQTQLNAKTGWPATPGIPVCTGTPCTAWGTTLTAPAGAIVGTNDTQTLTNKTVDGVSPATMGYVDPTSSIQTQLNAKAPSLTAHTISVPRTCTTTGSANTYACTVTPAFTPAAGDSLTLDINVANTGASTLAVDGGTAYPITKYGTNHTALVGGDLTTGHWISATFDGADWQLEGQLGNAPTTLVGTSSDVTAQSTSQSAVTLATAPTAGQYRVLLYADMSTACSTGSNSVTFTISWTDGTNARSATVGPLTLTASQATSIFVAGETPLYVGSGNVTYLSTVLGTCATGTSKYDVHASLRTP